MELSCLHGCSARDLFYLLLEVEYQIQLLYLVITINYLKLQSQIFAGTKITMDKSKFFNSSSKKRDFSDQSYNGEEAKKAREGSLNDSSVSLDDVLLRLKQKKFAK